ncbi:hypothetical protein PoB_001132200 [Plakobranchus ocellatus]|uniref:Uncharacterized protein n=1 Tax=Plakobranchus ocellatus TaxID=259542 RepID=A0AAV3YRQ0_9GAST|nr:hypothetical protein PoB_001132200 [Plakobranchus ocellatus]
MKWLIRANSDLDWNRRGEIKYKSDWIQGSNLTDLVSEALRYKPREDKAFPTGWKEFQDILIAENVPRKLLGAGSNHTSAASPLGSGQKSPSHRVVKKYKRGSLFRLGQNVR